MLLFVAALIAATLAGGTWCAGVLLLPRLRGWWQVRRRISISAIALVAVLIVAGVLRYLFVPPHHAMYLDEPWYAEAACNVWRFGRLVLCEQTWTGTSCVPFEKAPGWPVFIAPWSALVGCDSAIGIYINRILGVATVLLAAIAARCAGAAWWPSVVAAAIVAIHPIHVAWSATGETNVPAALALLIGICGALVYARTACLCGAALAVSALGLATAIRPESLVPALVIGAMLLAVGAAPRRQRLAVSLAIALVCAAAALSGRYLWTMNESISGGAFLAAANIVRNARQIGEGLSLSVHGVVLLVALVGAVALVRSQRGGVAALLLSAAASAAIVALAYDRFHERMLLGATLALVPLIACAFEWGPRRSALGRASGPLAGAIVVMLAVLLWRPVLQSAVQPTETQLLETRIAARISALTFPPDALFIAEQPTVLAAGGIAPVMASGRALDGAEELAEAIRRGRAIYFLRDMYCEPGFEGTGSVTACGEILRRFVTSPIVEESLNARTYGLYRLLPRGEQ
jgi:hypothetical protein